MESSVLSFNFLNLVLGVVTLHGAFLSLLLFGKKHPDKAANRYLGVAVLFVSLMTLNYLVFASGSIYFMPHWLNAPIPLLWLIAPAVYFFILKLLNPSFRHKWWHVVHLVPAAFYLWQFLPVHNLPPDSKLQLISSIMKPVTYSMPEILLGNLKTFQVLFYGMLSIAAIRKAAQRTNGKKVTKESLFSLKIFVAVFCGLWLLMPGLGLVFHWLGLLPSTMEYILIVMVGILIHLLSYSLLSEKAFFSKAFLPLIPARYRTSPLSEAEIENICTRLQAIIQNEKPFLQPDLKVTDLADLLGIPAHHLSQALSEGFHSNFYDFLNQYRVEEVKDRFTKLQYAHYSILAIAFDCGFNSKSSFNRVFKKWTGMTPSKSLSENLV